MQQCIFDWLRAVEASSGAEPPAIVTDGYTLTDEEEMALTDGNVSAFHRMGVHPVLINAYCRAHGWKRADYRVLFDAEDQAPHGRTVRWQTS